VSSTGILVALMYSWELHPPFWKDLATSLDGFQCLYGSKLRNWFLGNVFDRMEQLPQPWADLCPPAVMYSIFGVLIFIRVLYDVLVAAAIFLYALARVYLVVECFINLVHLPDSAYLVPQWSQYVPHIS
jgi:hypothetical protein